MSDTFNFLEQLVRSTVIRQGVIASNIANADTPNYKAKDVSFSQALDDATLELKTTNARHVTNIPAGLSEDVIVETTQPWADGNNVEVDMEIAKMTENALLFQAAITMLSTKIRMFKNALRR